LRDALDHANSLEQPLPPTNVSPSAHFPTDLSVDANWREAAHFVKGNTGIIGKGNSCKGGVTAFRFQRGEKRAVERPAHATSGKRGINIDCNVTGG
jgi:hypothetical protein